ncbi:MAG: tricarballylate utilization 4Fe-4S protein TcuB [Pseudomonadota bacterium]
MTTTEEARRQIMICNACRYCEGYCAVFPAITRGRDFSDGDITHLAHLCHNCRGCYHACQYTEPHEFALNVPAALAAVRRDSTRRFAPPAALARLFHDRGVGLAAALVAGLAALFAAIAALRPESGDGFYAVLSHTAMVAIFAPAFLAPLAIMALAVRRQWRETGDERLRLPHIIAAAASAGRLKNLSGGQGQGCHFERGTRATNARRIAHQMTAGGFLLCFASTSSGTVMHYLLDWPAPYAWYTAPKLLGVPGGILLTLGALWLARLKRQSDPALGTPGASGGEMAFTLLLAATGATGLALYAATGTALVPALLAIHLGAVLALFITLPFSKMAHGFYRFTALVREAQFRTNH